MQRFPRAADGLAAVVLAAGAGTRLRPLTDIRPKALCPVGNRPLVDHALERARRHTDAVAVNLHHGRAQLEAHLRGSVRLSVEETQVLGTAGALGALRDWIAGRPVLVLNADAWHPDDLDGLLGGWDGARIRLLVVEDRDRPDFAGRYRFAGASIMPWAEVRGLAPVPSGLYRLRWAPHEAAGTLDIAVSDVPFIDCGTPADYLAANLAAAGSGSLIAEGAVVEGAVERSVVGEGAAIRGSVERSVVWPGGVVGPGESLVQAIRVGAELTVQT